jgi:membrane-associated phospholipid phosphatase
MRQNVSFFVAGSVIFLSFVLFSYLIHKDLFTQIDFNTTVRLQDNLPRRLDPVFSWFSIFGNFEVMVVILLGVLGGVGVLGFSRKIIGSVVAFGLFGFFHVIELFGKYMVDHPPPPEFMLRTEHPVDFPQFYVRTESSYPSGHSGRTIFVAIILLFFIYKSSLSPLIKFTLYGGVSGYVIVMLLSRIYLGEHWTSDVIGGGLLACSFALVSIAFLQKSTKIKEKKSEK